MELSWIIAFVAGSVAGAGVTFAAMLLARGGAKAPAAAERRIRSRVLRAYDRDVELSGIVEDRHVLQPGASENQSLKDKIRQTEQEIEQVTDELAHAQSRIQMLKLFRDYRSPEPGTDGLGDENFADIQEEAFEELSSEELAIEDEDEPAASLAISGLMSESSDSLSLLDVLTSSDPKELQASFYCPETFKSNASFMAQIGLSFEADRKTLDERAGQADPDAVVRGTEEGIQSPEIGTPISFALSCNDADIDEVLITKVWRGRPLLAQFDVQPKSGVEALTIRAAVIVEGIEIGTLKWRVRAEDARHQSPSGPETGRTSYLPESLSPQSPKFRMLGQSVFVSYSSKDTDEVVRRVQAIRALGIPVFLDFLDIEAGREWSEKLKSEIASSERFLLFWSESAAASEEVEKEWIFALECQTKSVFEQPTIIPVMISRTAPRPPEQLAHLHFDRALTYIYE